MNAKSIFVVLAACAVIAGLPGCSSNSQPPAVADVLAQAERAREANQRIVDGIRNNPSLSDDQKAQMIARISRGQIAKPQSVDH